ncbi:MAG: NAD(P)-binding domain-containing protein [Deltaproteobacteria bacterium]|nr:NAD(P)-binding domain-containing protein [Deltaproteobacteria bacterium]
MERLLVMGTGPIGGIIGGRLARAGQDVIFVDVDEEHIAAICANGLQVDVPDGPFNVKISIARPDEIQGKFDIVFIAVRSNYTADTLKAALPHLTDNGLLVSLQNGINPPLLEKEVGPDRTVGVAIRMGSRRVAPGQLYTDSRGHLYLGHLHGRTTLELRNLHELLNSVIPSEITANILAVLWSKLTYTCLGYFGSLADASLATSCSDKRNRGSLVEFMGEVVAVGDALGARFIPLDEYNPPDLHPRRPFQDRLSIINNYARSWKPEDRKGPLRQMQQGIVTEVDYTLGYVVQEGNKLCLNVRICEAVLDMIRDIQKGKRQLQLQNYEEIAGLIS